MPYNNEFANAAITSRLFNDEQLQTKLNNIHTQMKTFDLNENEVEFEHYNPTTDITDYDKLIAIDGSITPTVEIDYIPYRLVRIIVAEIDPEKHIQLDINKTHNFKTLYDLTDNITEIHIPFLDFDHPESSTRFDTFVKQQLNDIQLYTHTIEQTINNATQLLLNYENSYEATCQNCNTEQQVTTMNAYCNTPDCNNQFDKYTPLQFFNGYRPEEFMVFMENLTLLNVMDEETNTLILKDGPLSQAYTPSAYIKNAFQHIYQISQEYDNETRENTVLGIEKSGRFQSILDDIELNKIQKPAVAPIPEQVLTNPGYDGSLLYGEPTHFGKRFFICPYDNARYTIYVPRLPQHEHETLASDIEDYQPEIDIAVKVSQEYMSPRYNNSLFPIIIANQQASLPQNANYEHYMKRTLNQ